MLIHFVADEFLELEATELSERRLIAGVLGLDRLDLTECKVFVNFTRSPLDRRNLHAKINADPGDGHESLELFPT